MRLPAPGLSPAHTPLPRGASDDGGASLHRPSRVRRLRRRRARQTAVVSIAVVVVSLAFVQAQAKDVPGVGVWVMERSNAPLLGKAAGGFTEAVASAVGAGASAESVRVVVSGKVHDVVTNAGSVGELLSAMGIDPDADDRVVPSPSAPLHVGDPIQVDLIDIRLLTTSVRVPFPVTTDYSTDVGIGATHVVSPGAPGSIERIVEQVVVNGEVVGMRVVSSTLVTSPVAEFRLAGPAAPDGGSITVPGVGGRTQFGMATWYDPPWSGLTAAHPWLPKGTYVNVTDVATGRSVTVVIDDRGPFGTGRVIDLSPEAFEVLAPLGRGVLRVQLDW